MTIGSNDVIDLLELSLNNVVTKIFNQSYLSTLNCHAIQEVDTDSGKHLEIELLHMASGLPTARKFLFSNFSKSTKLEKDGSEESKYIIETTVVIFDQLFLIDLLLIESTFSDHLLALGNEFMKDKFNVDLNLSNLSYNLKSQIRI